MPRTTGSDTHAARLRQLIRLVRAVKLKVQNPTEPAWPPTPPAPNKPAADASRISVPEANEPSGEATGSPWPTSNISRETLKMLEQLAAEPRQVLDPLGVAEILHRNHHTKLAAVFYQEALRRNNGRDQNAAADKAWILFQAANCLREHDHVMAGKLYEDLIAGYPESPWVDVARARYELLQWYHRQQVPALLSAGPTRPTADEVRVANKRR